MSNEKSTAIESIIGCGRFQLLVYICCQWVMFAQAWNLMSIVFNKGQPKWTCWDEAPLDSGNGTWYDHIWNSSLSENQKQCAIREGCKNLTYSYGYRSIVTEWDLVCEREWILYFVITIQMAGMLVGAPIFGQLADSFGRRRILFLVVAGILVSGGASAACPNWKAYAVFTFFIGFFCGGSSATGYVLMVEMLSQKHRLWVPSIGGWPLASVFLSLMAYMAQSWRVLAAAVNILALPSLGLILYIGESPRWLLHTGRVDEGLAQLKRVSGINKSHIDENHWAVLEESKVQKPEGLKNEGRGKTYTYWHLFSTKRMTLHTVVLSVCFFCLSNISFGLTFNIDKLSGSVYMNFFYMACLRWFGGILTIVADTLIRGFGRRVGAVLPASLIATAATITLILHLTSPNWPPLATTTRVLLLFAASMCSPIWIAVPLANNELFPTPIRNMAVAFCAIFNRLGGVVMPQILYLAMFWKLTPFVAYLVFSLILGVLFVVAIPETKDQPLPQHMPERRRREESVTERSDSFAIYKFVNVNQEALLKEREAA